MTRAATYSYPLDIVRYMFYTVAADVRRHSVRDDLPQQMIAPTPIASTTGSDARIAIARRPLVRASAFGFAAKHELSTSRSSVNQCELPRRSVGCDRGQHYEMIHKLVEKSAIFSRWRT